MRIEYTLSLFRKFLTPNYAENMKSIIIGLEELLTPKVPRYCEMSSAIVDSVS